jgi:predicted cupin superfamily sugar epimerase
MVPAHAWQAAQSLGEWTLVSCTVAPGFDFKGFEMAANDWAPGAATLRLGSDDRKDTK